MYSQALDVREKMLGDDHPDPLASVYCLAHLLHQQQLYGNASLLYQRACSHDRGVAP